MQLDILGYGVSRGKHNEHHERVACMQPSLSREVNDRWGWGARVVDLIMSFFIIILG